MHADSLGGGFELPNGDLAIPLVDIVDSMPLEVLAECIGLCVSRMVQLTDFPTATATMEGVVHLLKNRETAWRLTNNSQN